MPSVRFAAISIALVSLALAGCGSSGSPSPPTKAASTPPGATKNAARTSSGGLPPGPRANIDAANFTARVDNPWFPLEPGSTYRYRGSKDGKPAVEVLKVTDRTKTILGVANTVVDDRLYLGGKLEEKTSDWYSQDRRGNVWYFGEATATLDAKGKVDSREGSFEAGVNGARPGIYMSARPQVGQSFQQEYYRGQAEDRFKVVDLSASVRVPLVSTGEAMQTIEWTPLEPKVLDTKYYLRGVGTVLEDQLKGPGPKERLELVSFKR